MASRDPVIIVGAGPAGLTLAVSLTLQDVPVVILEREPKLPRDERAGSFHPPTIEMFEPLGIAEEFLAMGIKVPRWQICDGRTKEVVVEWDLNLIADETPYPFRLQCEQFKLAPLLHRRLQAVGGPEILFSHDFIDATQDPDGVTVRARTPAGTETVRGSYLVGADGGRSTVRTAMGVEFEGFTWQERFLIVSTTYDLGAHGYRENVYISDPVDWIVLVKMPHDGPPGIWRVTFATDPDSPEEFELSPENVENRLQAFIPRSEPYDVGYANLYRIHQRVASAFRVSRMLLVGDAAHLNSPIGAFGLNSAVHAAVNLAEKLGPVCRGETDPALLDLYVRQRRQANIEFVQAQSIRNKRMMDERDPKVREANFAELREIAADRTRAKEFLLRSSMIASVRRAAAIS